MNEPIKPILPSKEAPKLETPKFSLPTKEEKEEKKEEKEEKPSYQNIRGQKIFKAKGNPIPEVNKILTPADAEELELCEYFANLGNLKKIK